MQKSELIKRMSLGTGIHNVDIIIVLDAFINEVKNALLVGDSVTLRGFGTFALKYRAAKTGRLIAKNEFIKIPEHYTPCFKAGRQFTKDIKIKVTPPQQSQ